MNAQSLATVPELNLSVPDKWASIDCVELNEALLKDRLKSLPANNLAAYVEEFEQSLARFHLNQLDAQQRLVLLDVYRHPMNALLFGNSLDSLLEGITNLEQRNSCIETIQAIFCSLAMGYKIVVVETLKKEANLRLNQLALMAINRVTEQLSLCALFAYRFYLSVPAKSLRELHQIFRFCIHHKSEDKTPKISGLLKSDRSVKSFYSQLMLMSICNPYGLAKGQVLKAYQIMQQLSSAVDINVMHESEQSVAGHFYVNCLSDKPPTPSVLQKREDQSHPPSLVINTKPALVKVDLLFQRSQMAGSSSQTVDLDLLKQLTPFLNTSYERKHFRTELQHKEQVVLAIGINEVYQAVAAINASSDVSSESLGQSWKVLNKNSSGYLVARENETAKHQLRVGDLIGVFGQTEKQDLDLLQLGFIRWLKTNDRNETKLGLALIVGQPVSVEYQTKTMEQASRGLFMPEVSRIHQAASLLTDKDVFSRHGKISIKPRKKKFQFDMTMSTLLETGKNFEHFSLSDEL